MVMMSDLTYISALCFRPTSPTTASATASVLYSTQHTADGVVLQVHQAVALLLLSSKQSPPQQFCINYKVVVEKYISQNLSNVNIFYENVSLFIMHFGVIYNFRWRAER